MENALESIQSTQAERIINKFGGARQLAKLLDVQPSTVYRWTYPKEIGGTAGLIPTQAWPEILKAARQEGIFITAEDMVPR